MNPEAQVNAASKWAGAVSPYGIGDKKLGMWLFIASDAITFAALLVAYGYVRLPSQTWPAPFHMWPSIVMASVMTVVLLSSSLTMVRAVEAAKAGETRRSIQFLGLTMLGGLGFVALHLNEWRLLIANGVRLDQNPWGDPMFGGTFFFLTGLHMVHVLAGVAYLGVVTRGLAKGRYTSADVEISGLYWHFVDLVWIFMFPLLYLLSIPTR